MSIYLHNATNHAVEKFTFERDDMKSNFMRDEIINVIDIDSSCDSSGDELDKCCLKYNSQSGFVSGDKILFNSVTFNACNKSLAEKFARMISHPVNPVSSNAISKSIPTFESLNTQLKKNSLKNGLTQGLKNSKLLTNENFCQLNLKKVTLPTVIEPSVHLDTLATNMVDMKNKAQFNHSNKNNESTKLKCSGQILCNKNNSDCQFRRKKLKRKRLSRRNLLAISTNRLKTKPLEENNQSNLIISNSGKSTNTSYHLSSCSSVNQMSLHRFHEAETIHIKTNTSNHMNGLKQETRPVIKESSKHNISSNIIYLKHVNSLKQKTTTLDGESSLQINLLNNCQLSSNLETKNEANLKITSIHLNGLEQKTTQVHEASSYNNNLLSTSRFSCNSQISEIKGEANFEMDISNESSNQVNSLKKQSSPVGNHRESSLHSSLMSDIKNTANTDHLSPSVNKNKQLNTATCNNKPITTFQEKRILSNEANFHLPQLHPQMKRILSNEPLYQPPYPVSQFFGNGILQKPREIYEQPTHLRFLKPKNTDLFKMRKLNDSSMAGYNCQRSDFSVEFDNKAEHVLSVAGHLHDLRLSKIADDDDSDHTEQDDTDLLEELELAVIKGYNSRLQERERKKKVVKEFGLINQKAVFSWQNKFEAGLGKEEFKKLVRFTQLLTFAEAEMLFSSLKLVYEKRAGVNKMMFYRSQRGISTRTDIKIFESQRSQFEPKLQRTDINKLRFSSSIIEVCPKRRQRRSTLELFGMPRYRELTNTEAELCSATRLSPEFFLEAKATLIADCKKYDGVLLKRARKLFRKDVNKTRKIYDLLMEQGLIWLPDPAKS